MNRQHIKRLGVAVMFFCMHTASASGGASSCPADSVPIQIYSSGAVYDPPGIPIEHLISPVTTLSALSATEFDEPALRALATTVTRHVAARLAKEKLCLSSAASKQLSLLRFTEWPFYIVGNFKPPARDPVLDTPSSSGCRLTSPWIDLVFERQPVPWIRGIVRLNERQALVDQAILSGVANVAQSMAVPLQQNEFIRHMRYIDSGGKFDEQSIARSSPDILWLLGRLGWQPGASYLKSFTGKVIDAIRKLQEKNAEHYTTLVTALIDRCLAAHGEDVHYNSILDVADLISLEQYKIVTPIR